MNMDPETSKALEDSIEAWRKIVAGTAPVHGSEGCPLCDKFLSTKKYPLCNDCPVKARTGHDGCKGTPYYSTYIKRGVVPSTPEERAAALAELEFLISLREPSTSKAEPEPVKVPLQCIRVWEPGIKANPGELLVRLVSIGLKTWMVAVNVDGNIFPQGCLIGLGPKGFEIEVHISPDFGFELNSQGQIPEAPRD